jgi:multisubunit Na+/H+ antiporter MnhG subunit
VLELTDEACNVGAELTAVGIANTAVEMHSTKAAQNKILALLVITVFSPLISQVISFL